MIFYKVECFAHQCGPKPVEKIILKNKHEVLMELFSASIFCYDEGECTVEYFSTKAEAVKHYNELQRNKTT